MQHLTVMYWIPKKKKKIQLVFNLSKHLQQVVLNHSQGIYHKSLSCFKKKWRNIIQNVKYGEESRPFGLFRIAPK